MKFNTVKYRHINYFKYRHLNIKTMKKLFTLIFLMAFGLMSKIEAQAPGNVAMVLQKCIDLPTLQQYFPIDNEGNLKQLRINYWHPLLFPIDLPIVKDGKKVQFNAMSAQNEKNGEAYFLFKTFNIKQVTSNVLFEYYYGNNTNSKTVEVKLELQQ